MQGGELKRSGRFHMEEEEVGDGTSHSTDFSGLCHTWKLVLDPILVRLLVFYSRCCWL
jgi:hypothetical protein